MKNSGLKVSIGRLYRSIPKNRRVILIHKALLDSYTSKFIAYARSKGCVLVYDTDDLIFVPEVSSYLSSVSGVDYQNTIPLYRSAMAACDVVLVSTINLCESASRFHPDVRVMKNALCQQYFTKANEVASKKKVKANAMVTVAYLSGSASHDRDFQLVESDLLKLLEEGKNIKVLLVGSLNFSRKFYQYDTRFEYRKFVNYDQLPNLFANIDINLIPLEIDEEFVQGKSELKFIEAGICAVPSIASPTELHCQIIEHEVSGILVQENRWYESIYQLLENPNLRFNLGCKARVFVEKNHAPDIRAQEWVKLIDDVWTKYRINSGPINEVRLSRLMSRADLETIRWVRWLKILIGRLFTPFRKLVRGEK